MGRVNIHLLRCFRKTMQCHWMNVIYSWFSSYFPVRYSQKSTKLPQEIQLRQFKAQAAKMSYLQILSAVIAFSSIISNFMVCILFLRNKAWLKRPYNVFILSLAVTDMITGFIMLLSPGLIFTELVKIPNISFLGSLYCKVLWTRWLLFALGAVSVYTCLALTIERWTAICRPFKYRTRFASKSLIGYICLTWIIAFIVSSIGFIEGTYQPATSNFTRPSCKMTPLVKGDLIGVVSTISVSLKFFLPSLVIIGLYALAIRTLIKSQKLNVKNRRNEAIKNVTKMATVSTIALIFCWMPNQVTHADAQFTAFPNLTYSSWDILIYSICKCHTYDITLHNDLLKKACISWQLFEVPRLVL